MRVFLLALWLVCGLAQASEPIPQATQEVRWRVYKTGPGSIITDYIYESKTDACVYAESVVEGRLGDHYSEIVSDPEVDGSCWIASFRCASTADPGCQTVHSSGPGAIGETSYPLQSQSVWACPSNLNVVVGGGGTEAFCVCPDGKSWHADGVCTGCTLGTVVSSGFYDIGTDPSASPGILRCQSDPAEPSGCEVIFDGVSPAGSTIVGGVKRWYAQGAYVATGNTCSTHGNPTEVEEGSTDPEPNACGPGQVQGTINDRVVCVDQQTGEVSTPSTETPTETTETRVETDPDGTVRKITETTRCDTKGNCEKVTTTETTRPDGTTGRTESRTPVSGTGTPTSPDGDPDDEEEPTPECEEGDTSLRCLQTGDPGTPDDVTGIERVVSITPATGFQHDTTCPADKVLNLAHVTLTIPFTLLCTAADYARPVVIAVAWLSALLGFFGLSRRE